MTVPKYRIWQMGDIPISSQLL